jgi:type VI secretion system protein ImpM
MPEPLTSPDTAVFRNLLTHGFCGKLPAVGDFVSAGLPRRFVDPWHDWVQRMLAGSREILGEDWKEAWLGAPVWRFQLSPGLCGPDAALGLWMPSVDRVGRYFPLTFAILAPALDAAAVTQRRAAFLASAEAAGRDALEYDLAPDEIIARIAKFSIADPEMTADPVACSSGGSLWWSDGSERVVPTTIGWPMLPDEAGFARMLDDAAPVAAAGCGERV